MSAVVPQRVKRKAKFYCASVGDDVCLKQIKRYTLSKQYYSLCLIWEKSQDLIVSVNMKLTVHLPLIPKRIIKNVWAARVSAPKFFTSLYD